MNKVFEGVFCMNKKKVCVSGRYALLFLNLFDDRVEMNRNDNNVVWKKWIGKNKRENEKRDEKKNYV